MNAPRILIIEDEPKVALFIKQGLEDNEFIADIAYDGQSGLSMALDSSYNSIILDLNLPLIHGYEVCKEIRKRDTQVPILMLTAFGTTKDKLKGFDAGTDDYLVKPFEFTELLARIRALMKRSGTPAIPNIIGIGNLEMNLDAKTVKRNNEKIVLTAKEFALLEYFIKNKGRVLSRTEIAEKVWDINFDTHTNVIDVYVNFLRKKIDRNFSPKLIHTLIGMGYVLKEENP